MGSHRITVNYLGAHIGKITKLDQLYDLGGDDSSEAKNIKDPTNNLEPVRNRWDADFDDDINRLLDQLQGKFESRG